MDKFDPVFPVWLPDLRAAGYTLQNMDPELRRWVAEGLRRRGIVLDGRMPYGAPGANLGGRAQENLSDLGRADRVGSPSRVSFPTATGR